MTHRKKTEEQKGVSAEAWSNAEDMAGDATYLDVARPSIEVKMTALDIAVVCKFINDFLFGCFLVDVCYYDDPSFHSCRTETLEE